jgi:hypothetical protein
METEKLKTENRLTIMEQKIDNLKEDISEVKDAVKGIATDIKDHVKWEAEKYEKLDGKYSAKWVETGVIAIITAIIISAIIGLATYFFKN